MAASRGRGRDISNDLGPSFAKRSEGDEDKFGETTHRCYFEISSDSLFLQPASLALRTMETRSLLRRDRKMESVSVSEAPFVILGRRK